MYSDPYEALSFDRLHTFHSGLFGDHLWTQLKKHIESLGRDASTLVDDV